MKILNISLLYLFLNVCVVSHSQVMRLDNAEIISTTRITETAYCSDGTDRGREGKRRFHGPMEARIISFDNYQYMAYYEGNGEVVVARKNLEENSAWEKSILQGYTMTSEDRHNKLALSISKGDGVIHLAFDHHNTPHFNYAHSKLSVATHPETCVWDNSTFVLQPNLGLSDETGLVTYPAFHTLNTTGDLIVYWRTGGSVGGEMNLASYHSKDHKWSFIGRISSQEGTYLGQKSSRGPYATGFLEDNDGTMHVSWIFRERAFSDKEGAQDRFGEHGLLLCAEC